jgi:SAM-dependent methyltransferase
MSHDTVASSRSGAATASFCRCCTLSGRTSTSPASTSRTWASPICPGTEIEPSSFDAVYCSNLIEHVPDPLAFLAKCREVLKPGGVIVGVTPDHLSLDRYVFGRYWAGYHYPRHTFIFNHRNIRTLLEKAGFDVVRIKGSHAYWYLSLANLVLELPGTRKRGFAFAAITSLFAPLDLLVNRVRVHGSMTFIGRRIA